MITPKHLAHLEAAAEQLRPCAGMVGSDMSRFFQYVEDGDGRGGLAITEGMRLMTLVNMAACVCPDIAQDDATGIDRRFGELVIAWSSTPEKDRRPVVKQVCTLLKMPEDEQTAWFAERDDIPPWWLPKQPAPVIDDAQPDDEAAREAGMGQFQAMIQQARKKQRREAGNRQGSGPGKGQGGKGKPQGSKGKKSKAKARGPRKPGADNAGPRSSPAQ